MRLSFGKVAKVQKHARNRDLPLHPYLEAQVPGRSDYNEWLTVYASTSRKSFQVSKAKACARSPWFVEQTAPGWILAGRRALYLPEVDVDVFRMWLLSLDRPSIDFEVDEASTTTTQQMDGGAAESPQLRKTSKKTDQEFTHLINLYILAIKLGDIRLQNSIADDFIQHSARSLTVPSLSTATFTYDKTPAGCHLQWLILELLVDYADRDVFAPLVGDGPDCQKLMRQICAGRKGGARADARRTRDSADTMSMG